MKTIFFLSVLFTTMLSAITSFPGSTAYVYSANAGWLSFRGSVSYGVYVSDTYLSGYAYAANFGWIHLGDGSPANGWSYQNNSATDYGVNMDSNGHMTGYAYAANIGWINFEQTHGKPRLNFQTGKISGSIYSANIGWISLDTAFSDLTTAYIALADADNDGIADSYEMQYFGSLTTANATTDTDGDCQNDLAEYIAGTAPNDASDQLRVISHEYGYNADKDKYFALLNFTSVSNRLYRIEYSTTMQPGSWTDSELGTFIPAAGSVTLSEITRPNAPRCFFRVQAIRPLPPFTLDS